MKVSRFYSELTFTAIYHQQYVETGIMFLSMTEAICSQKHFNLIPTIFIQFHSCTSRMFLLHANCIKCDMIAGRKFYMIIEIAICNEMCHYIIVSAFQQFELTQALFSLLRESKRYYICSVKIVFLPGDAFKCELVRRIRLFLH